MDRGGSTFRNHFTIFFKVVEAEQNQCPIATKKSPEKGHFCIVLDLQICFHLTFIQSIEICSNSLFIVRKRFHTELEALIC